MCTASWSIGKSGYSFIFSRDELRTRIQALPPRLCKKNGVDYLSPLDPQGGGSWIIANEFGLIVCLLNNYAASKEIDLKNAQTRGAIPISLSNFRSIAECLEYIKESDLAVFPPFHLCCFERSGKGLLLSWDGHVLGERDLAENEMITSSSFMSETVQKYRGDLFRNMSTANEDDLFKFHTHGDHVDPAFNPVMSRSDARTQSMCILNVHGTQLSFRYLDRNEDSLDFFEVSKDELRISDL